MALPAIDDFNRANGPLGANWTTSPSDNPALEILSNEANSGDDSFALTGAFWNADVFRRDQFSQAEFRAVSVEVGVTVRHNPGPEADWKAYVFEMEGGTGLTIFKLIGPGFTQLGSNGTMLSPGDIMRLEIREAALVGKINGVIELTGTDGSILSGSAGLWSIAAAADATQLDNWEAGDSDLTVPSGFVGQYPTIIRGGGR